MRVVGALLFALAFHVASIACVLFPDQHPPYRVVRMSQHDLPGVLTEYETEGFEASGGKYRVPHYHPVDDYLDVVIKLDQSVVPEVHRIIGSADHNRILQPIEINFVPRRATPFATMIFNPPHQAGDPQMLYDSEARDLGMWSELPYNTIFEGGLRRHQPPPRKIILVNDNFQKIGVRHEDVIPQSYNARRRSRGQ